MALKDKLKKQKLPSAPENEWATSLHDGWVAGQNLYGKGLGYGSAMLNLRGTNLSAETFKARSWSDDLYRNLMSSLSSVEVHEATGVGAIEWRARRSASSEDFKVKKIGKNWQKHEEIYEKYKREFRAEKHEITPRSLTLTNPALLTVKDNIKGRASTPNTDSSKVESTGAVVLAGSCVGYVGVMITDAVAGLMALGALTALTVSVVSAIAGRRAWRNRKKSSETESDERVYLIKNPDHELVLTIQEIARLAGQSLAVANQYGPLLRELLWEYREDFNSPNLRDDLKDAYVGALALLAAEKRREEWITRPERDAAEAERQVAKEIERQRRKEITARLQEANKESYTIQEAMDSLELKHF